MTRRILLSILLLVVFVISALPATFYVTNNADNGTGTLRDALTQAATNGSATTDHIYFNFADQSMTGRTIDLLTELPALSSNLVTLSWEVYRHCPISKTQKANERDHNIKIQGSMNEELQKWHTKLTLGFKVEDQPVNRLHAILVEMKKNGISKDQAYELLASLRKDCSTEDQVDNILHLMDIVVGHCLPENRIWE